MGDVTDHVDVLIIGAGLSGIGAASHLASDLPDKTYAILERRDAIGGTWDLFTYPGIRSDSDMHTLGYRFRPWPEDKVLADGPAIKQYVVETAAHYGVTDKIRFGHHAMRCAWDSDQALWTVDYEVDGKPGQITCSFLWGCSGYYDYDRPYTPTFPGIDKYAGRVIHPQHWPDDLDYAGKTVVVIGSGATAITLIPAMADETESITMLQRTPSYVVSVPTDDPLGSTLRKVLPDRVAAGVTRWRNVLIQSGLYQMSRRRPGLVKRLIRNAQVSQLPRDFEVDTHFAPPYNPWDQRLCVVPSGDLFRAISHGKAKVATGHIETFTKTGIRLTDGTELEADIVITATGLNLLAFGGTSLTVDGEEVKLSEKIAYKGLMLDGVPNFAYVVGYANASWTLKADLVSEYVVRVLKKMDKHGDKVVMPVRDEEVSPAPLLDLSSGYVQRSLDKFPQQGDRGPWKAPHNYLRDIVTIRHRKLDDSALQFS